jgi:hypothetical protein
VPNPAQIRLIDALCLGSSPARGACNILIYNNLQPPSKAAVPLLYPSDNWGFLPQNPSIRIAIRHFPRSCFREIGQRRPERSCSQPEDRLIDNELQLPKSDCTVIVPFSVLVPPMSFVQTLGIHTKFRPFNRPLFDLGRGIRAGPARTEHAQHQEPLIGSMRSEALDSLILRVKSDRKDSGRVYRIPRQSATASRDSATDTKAC